MYLSSRGFDYYHFHSAVLELAQDTLMVEIIREDDFGFLGTCKVRFNIGTHTTGHFCCTQRHQARNALIIKGNRYQSLRTLRRCVENVQ